MNGRFGVTTVLRLINFLFDLKIVTFQPKKRRHKIEKAQSVGTIYLHTVTHIHDRYLATVERKLNNLIRPHSCISYHVYNGYSKWIFLDSNIYCHLSYTAFYIAHMLEFVSVDFRQKIETTNSIVL